MFLAKEIMSQEIVIVSPETLIYDVLASVIEKNVSMVSIVDDDQTLRGVISEKDLLKLMVDMKIDRQDVVGSFMVKQVISFDENENIINIYKFLMSNPIRRVPIVSKGKLVGGIGRREILERVFSLRSDL